MDERAALAMLAEELPHAGDDVAVVDGLAVTTDFLRERTDFPAGTTRRTAGWRSVGASLSDLAATGADPTAAVAVYAAPAFEAEALQSFVAGARAVCADVGAEYVGGDLDEGPEFAAGTTAVGRVDDPIRRSGAAPGQAVCVTGTFGRSAAALRLFERGTLDRANELFRFPPRVAAGRALSSHATAMLDSSDGLARSLHQLAAASGVGAAVAVDALPVHDAVDEVAADAVDRRELAVHFGEDFELVCTIPEAELAAARDACPVSLTRIGETTDGDGVVADGEPLPDRGFTHGE